MEAAAAEGQEPGPGPDPTTRGPGDPPPTLLWEEEGAETGATAGGPDQDQMTEEESRGPEIVTLEIDHAPDPDHKEMKVTNPLPVSKSSHNNNILSFSLESGP